MWIDDNTLATPERVGVTAPALGNARVVIKSEMRAAERADIPASVGVLRLRLEDGMTVRRLILAVALWGEDETPEDAMRAGFQAFRSELRAAVADNLFALSQADDEQEKEIIATIETRVKSRVASAIENGLTGWQKVRVLLGTLNLDDSIGSAFSQFREIVPTPITLAFGSPSFGNYDIQGEFQVRPVLVNLCQAQVNAVKAAQTAVDEIDAQIQGLQDQLHGRGEQPVPSKTFINAEIKRLREQELPVAMAALEDARKALQACRDRFVVDSGGVLATVRAT
jgi:hypothetical protein